VRGHHDLVAGAAGHHHVARDGCEVQARPSGDGEALLLGGFSGDIVNAEAVDAHAALAQQPQAAPEHHQGGPAHQHQRQPKQAHNQPFSLHFALLCIRPSLD